MSGIGIEITSYSEALELAFRSARDAIYEEFKLAGGAKMITAAEAKDMADKPEPIDRKEMDLINDKIKSLASKGKRSLILKYVEPSPFPTFYVNDVHGVKCSEQQLEHSASIFLGLGYSVSKLDGGLNLEW
ncbi:MAG: hypothetical protein ACPHUL_00060 [Marinomonas gallaica]